MSSVGHPPALPSIDDLIEVAVSAGAILAARFPRPGGRELDPLEVEFKGRRDIVTDADLASETHILDALGRLLPGVPILSEERPDPGVRDGALWIVDPLDGTTNFAHGHPLFTVSIALCHDGDPVLGVIHAPLLGDTWSATRGGGTRRNGVPVQVDVGSALGDALLATGFSYDRFELDRGALAVFEGLLRDAREIRRGGSACLDLAHTACGIFAGFWEADLKPHDVAAGALLVREAGGRVTDFRGADDWLFGRSLVAGGPAIHTRLLERVSDLPHGRRSGTEGETPPPR